CFIITAYDFLQNVRMAERINADGYFIKPLVFEDVLYRIKKILKEQHIEKKLKESEEKYRALFENTGTATMIVEEDGTISMVNTQGEKLSGYSKDEIENKMKWTDFVIPEDMEKMKKCHIAMRKAGEKPPTEYEFSFIDRKGNVKDIFLKIGMVPNTKRSITSLMDITKHKISEEKLKKTMDAAIDTMSKIVEAKDPYTAGHQKNVSQIATFIAQEMKLPQDKIEGIRIASLFHDIGKISVPTELLNKSTTLSDIEFSLIKDHSQIGYDILKSIDFSYPVASVILQHHERLDGTGYPNNLKGDEILLEAKILGVADVVEAISSQRPYRPSLGIDKALVEISKNKAILYDSKVVDACLKIFKEKAYLNFYSVVA
ncbi:MAG: PAS domain S-box protein, partial [Desulfobacterales bacterium]|nr:PAS domain S-box protein [Desulfobacterales bacterium]